MCDVFRCPFSKTEQAKKHITQQAIFLSSTRQHARRSQQAIKIYGGETGGTDEIGETGGALPIRPTLWDGFYFSCGPVAALGFFVGGLWGFSIALLANALFWLWLAFYKNLSRNRIAE